MPVQQSILNLVRWCWGGNFIQLLLNICFRQLRNGTEMIKILLRYDDLLDLKYCLIQIWQTEAMWFYHGNIIFWMHFFFFALKLLLIKILHLTTSLLNKVVSYLFLKKSEVDSLCVQWEFLDLGSFYYLVKS